MGRRLAAMWEGRLGGRAQAGVGGVGPCLPPAGLAIQGVAPHQGAPSMGSGAGECCRLRHGGTGLLANSGADVHIDDSKRGAAFRPGVDELHGGSPTSSSRSSISFWWKPSMLQQGGPPDQAPQCVVGNLASTCRSAEQSRVVALRESGVGGEKHLLLQPPACDMKQSNCRHITPSTCSENAQTTIFTGNFPRAMVYTRGLE